MRERTTLFLVLLLLAEISTAQVVGPGFVNYVTSAPSGTCSQGVPAQIVMGSGDIYTCASGTWAKAGGAGGGTVTSVSFTGGLISVANPTTTPALTVAGTSGGIPYFSAASTWASSGALGSGQFVLGGGAGATPTTSFSVVPVANGGTGTGSTLTGLVRGNASAMTAAELSGDCTTSGSNALTCSGLAPKASPTFTGTVTLPLLATTTNCAATGTSANPSVVTCSAAPAGSFACATNASTGTCQVNTTAVTTSSRIFVQPTAAANSLTCNAVSDTGLTAPRLLSQSNGASFTITLGTFATTALCFNYFIVN